MTGSGRARRSRYALAALALVLSLLATACGSPSTQPASQPAAAQPQQQQASKPQTMAELAQYAGADREQLLYEGAKTEGKLLIYTSLPIESMTPVVDAFKAKYSGIEVEIWRAKSENVLERSIKEAEAGRHEADVVETNGPELELLAREQLTQAAVSPHHKELVAGAIPDHQRWAATRINLFVQGINTEAIKQEELPKAWKDLLDPKWKGKLVVEEEDWDWFAGVVEHLGEEQGLQLFRDIAATNGFGIRRGHTVLAEMVSAGEVAHALTLYSYHADELKQKGAPIEWYVIEKAMGRPNGVAVLEKSPHPHAALLFYDYILGEGQKVMLDQSIMVSNTTIDQTVAKTPMTLLSPQVLIDEQDKWFPLWEEIVLKGGAQ